MKSAVGCFRLLTCKFRLSAKSSLSLGTQVSLAVKPWRILVTCLLPTFLCVPVTEVKVKEFWYDPFAQGDCEVETEIDMALLDKSSNFNVQRDVPILRRLCEELNFNKPVGVTPEAELSLTLDKWQLVKKQLQYDPAVFETWHPKCSSIQEAAEQAKHQAAKTFLSSSFFWLHGRNAGLEWTLQK